MLVTDGGFGTLMCKKCAQSHRIGLGGGGGVDTIKIGGVGEPRTGIMYASKPVSLRVTVCVGMYVFVICVL